MKCLSLFDLRLKTRTRDLGEMEARVCGETNSFEVVLPGSGSRSTSIQNRKAIASASMRGLRTTSFHSCAVVPSQKSMQKSC